MSSGAYQAFVQAEAAAGRRPISVSGWLKRQERARAAAVADIHERIHLAHESQVVEVYMGTRESPRLVASFPPGAQVGQVACHECSGSGWWGYGPEESVNGPCVDCKGTGREWVGLA